MKDLRELMEWLEARGEVVHVSREVDPDYELVAVAKKVNILNMLRVPSFLC